MVSATLPEKAKPHKGCPVDCYIPHLHGAAKTAEGILVAYPRYRRSLMLAASPYAVSITNRRGKFK